MLAIAQLAPLIASRSSSALLPSVTHRWSTDGWTTSGTDVLVLPDDVGGAHANVVSASRPQVSAINGRDAALFVGGANYIQTAVIPVESYPQIAVLWVWNGVQVAATQNHWAGQKSGSAPTASLVTYSLVANEVRAAVDGGVTVAYGASGNVPQVIMFCYDGAVSTWSWWRYQGGTATKGIGGGGAVHLIPDINLWSLGNRPSGTDPNGSRAALGELQTGSQYVQDADAPALLAAVAAEWGI